MDRVDNSALACNIVQILNIWLMQKMFCGRFIFRVKNIESAYWIVHFSAAVLTIALGQEYVVVLISVFCSHWLDLA